MLEARGRKYEPTPDDRLWLARAVQAEGRPYTQVARALVNLFMLQRSKGSQQTLAQLVRAYAQPVNPKWYPTGAMFLAHQRTPLEIKQAELRRDGHSMRTVFTPAVQAAVSLALEASFPSDVTDYAVPSLDATKRGYVARGPVVKGENRFWTRQPGWQGYFAGGASVAVVLLAMAAAYAAWGRS